MTREEVMAMEAGADLDDQVHVRVMGGCLHDAGFEHDPDGSHPMEGLLYVCKRGCGYSQHLGFGVNAIILWPRPEYSTDIAKAWTVVEKLKARGRALVVNDGTNHHPPTYEVQAGLDENGPWTFCAFEMPDGAWLSARAETAPLAICRAALLATLEAE
jgi:hypothetical protein